MPRIQETPLPDVGVRHEFETSSGERLGTITHRGGRRDLLIFDCEDDALAEMLGGTRVTEGQA
jgi:TrkA domain protein